jgi:hypothetical protein
MLVAHEFFDALPFHLIEVCHSFLTALLYVSLTSSNLLENSSRLERGPNNFYSRPSRQNCPETFGRPDYSIFTLTLTLDFTLS